MIQTEKYTHKFKDRDIFYLTEQHQQMFQFACFKYNSGKIECRIIS